MSFRRAGDGVAREVKLGLKFVVGLSYCQDNFTCDWLLAVKSVFCQGEHGPTFVL